MTTEYLLDTQVLVWLSSDKKRIGRETARILGRAKLSYSAVSVAELAMKASLNKLRFDEKAIDQWHSQGLACLPFENKAAMAFSDFSRDWVPDPFDRMIMAAATADNKKLITSDSRILAMGFDWVLDATT